MEKKLSITGIVSGLVLFGNSFASANFIDDLGDFGVVVVNIGVFLWSLVKFIVFGFKTSFNLIYQAFTYIFSDELFGGISDFIDNLSLYLGGPSATVFLSLFIISFLLIFIGFIFRVIKGQVNYKSTVKKYLKK